MYAKKVVSLLTTALMILGAVTVSADGKQNECFIETGNCTLIFASDGGSYIPPIEFPCGTIMSLKEYVPIKEGYVFMGWYSDPRTKQERVTEFAFSESDVVYAKWIDDGTPKAEACQAVEPDRLSNEEVLQYGSYIDEATGVPVTALWVQQQEQLKRLMELYNDKFN